MNINEHEFSDSIAEFSVNEMTDGSRIVLDTGAGGWYFFDKEDVKAMAEHFKLLGDNK